MRCEPSGCTPETALMVRDPTSSDTLMWPWTWQNLTGIAAGVGILTSLASLVISIWTRIDQRREAREWRREREPYFIAGINKLPDREGWRMLRLLFYSPQRIAFTMQSVEIRK